MRHPVLSFFSCMLFVFPLSQFFYWSCKGGQIAVNNIASYNFKHVIMSGKQSYTQRGTQKGATEGVKEEDIEKDRYRHYKQLF